MSAEQELANRIQGLLSRIPGSDLKESDVRQAALECRNEINEDTIAHGGDPAEPFVNFLVHGNVAVFTFFTSPFEIYVVSCDGRALISDFESSGYAMSDVEEHRDHLNRKYGKAKPDIVVERDVANRWMEMT